MATNDHSKADNPDLDWSQVRETVLMLNLAMARMTHAMRDGDKSIDSLSRSFTEMVGHIKFMQDTITEINEDDTRNNLLDHSAAIRANYTLDSDKQMFKDLLQGKSIGEIMPPAT